MKIAETYSHLNGFEFLRMRQKTLWKEIEGAIESVDAERCRTKKSMEKTRKGEMLYSPDDMNDGMEKYFGEHGWKKKGRQTFYVASDEKLMREIVRLPPEEQKEKIEKAGYKPIKSFDEPDFVKNRVAVEVQFGKYPFVAYDMFVRHTVRYITDEIDVGVEIVPMKALQKGMSTGVSYYEHNLSCILRQARGIPAVPLVLVGIEP